MIDQCRWYLLILAAAISSMAVAHDARPISIEIKEAEAAVFELSLKVSDALPLEVMPRFRFPVGCQREGESIQRQLPGAAILEERYRCQDGLEGREVSLSFPVPNPSLSTPA